MLLTDHVALDRFVVLEGLHNNGRRVTRKIPSRIHLSAQQINAMNFIKDLSVDKVLNLAEDTFNQVKPKTDVEARVYDVLSHKNWGSSSTILNQIARDSYDYDKCKLD